MKRSFFKIIFISFFFPFFAQNSEKTEEIFLPDVTTIVDGKTFSAGRDSVPDYSEILPENSSPSVELPEMSGVLTSDDSSKIISEQTQKDKDIYAQGELGAGYPFYFKGDFSIYRASGDSPFEIDFKHESAEGFARKKSNEGYFSWNTTVKGKKTLSDEKGTHKAEAEYKTSDDGLQLKSDSYSDMVKHTVFADFSSDWESSGGFLLFYGANGAWFNRYGEIMKNGVKSGDFLDSTKILDLNPYLGLGWQNENFLIKFTSLYALQANLAGKDNLLEAEGSSSVERTHRGEAKLDFSWQNDSLILGAEGSLIVGNAIGNQNVVPSFSLKADFKTEGIQDDRLLNFSISGGIKSHQEKIRDLENEYKFATVPMLPTETTDAFAKLALTVPFFKKFEAKSDFEFYKTLFDNGFWQGIYDDDGFLPILSTSGTIFNSGLYAIAPEKRTEFNTYFAFFADFYPFKMGVDWKSFWKDCPSLKDKQNLKFSLEYQSADSKWKFGTMTIFTFGRKSDKCPNVSAFANLSFTNNLSLALELNDIVKLFHGTKRYYAHSAFITTSGNALLLLKFRF